MYETFRKVLGKCMWLSTSTRPDITFAVNKIARFASKPTEDHYNALVHLVRYIKGTVDPGLRFKTGEFTALGYTDADYGSSDLQHRKSCTCYVFLINGTAVTWQSKLQASTSLSTAEAEYIAACSGTKEALWVKMLLDFFDIPITTVDMKTDNQAAFSHCWKSNNHPEIQAH